jgi:hypothetical protein
MSVYHQTRAAEIKDGKFIRDYRVEIDLEQLKKDLAA